LWESLYVVGDKMYVSIISIYWAEEPRRPINHNHGFEGKFELTLKSAYKPPEIPACEKFFKRIPL